MKKKIAILGSTGSIGTQALQVIEEHSDLYEAYVLTANRQADLLIEQARRFQPAQVVIADETRYAEVRDALADLPIQVYAGQDALCQVAGNGEVDIVLTALVGFAGLRPTVTAIRAHKQIALANKETLVVAGELVTQLACDNHAPILPVDSEHSAIFQSLMGDERNEIEKIILTASGGPFRKFTLEELKTVTPAMALRHPNWDMGAKITIDSATMMNKGFEVIEAKWLFGVEADRIQVVVHPQSIIHSAVQFCDGAVKAQLGVPDMRVPIQLAFSYPARLASNFDRLDWYHMQPLTFEEPDLGKFRCLALAFEALHQGGTMPCVVNAANEVVNLAFRQERCSFLEMADVIERTMQRATFIRKPMLDDYFESDAEARRIAQEMIQH
ncbi:MAG: 1-deoxy-D-xylulose-5-phosphate reductoisomerase [Bacteroidaceae bacterium]|nr:1-deoxy-D-xylulose-5-phosphate reductoisomerase [Bacteroidaceae bacterium]